MNRKEYLLTCLMEECSEVIKSASKAIRFGLDSEYDGLTNAESIVEEYNDICTLISMLEDEEFINAQTFLNDYRSRRNKVNHFYDIHQELNKK